MVPLFYIPKKARRWIWTSSFWLEEKEYQSVEI